MRYNTIEQAFSNDLYEYAAAQVLRKTAEKMDRGGSAPESRDRILSELRRCLLEGLIRPDCLLPRNAQKKQQKEAPAIHDKNYWIAAEKIGCLIGDGS